jgi:dihydroorotate dehydrogenase
MGFNNHGSEALATLMRQLREGDKWPKVPIGANIGKSKVTNLEDAPQDYATSIRRLQGLADYFTINVSSPNTPGLRELQRPDALKAILDISLEEAKGTPVAVKLAPDLEPEMVEQIVNLICEVGMSGIIATNTTIKRDGLVEDPNETGGLSGRPIWPQSRSIIEQVLNVTKQRIPVIGCGGVDSAERAIELMTLGCRAVQLYTALIFKGPSLPSKINSGLGSPKRMVNSV